MHFYFTLNNFLTIFESINLIWRKYILPPGVYMKSPLICDQRDSKWKLLGEILKIFGSRRVKQEIAKHGIKPADKAGIMFRVMFTSMFFSVDVSYVLRELNEREELRKFVGVEDVPDVDSFYRFMSRFSENQFVKLVNGVLNTQNPSKRRRNATILVDSTDLQVDLNWNRKKRSKKSLEDEEFKWGCSSSKGFYIGYKLTIALEYPKMKPLAFIIHQGSPNDAPIFTEIMEQLKNRRLILKGDTFIFDKGYYSKDNYINGILGYNIVPIIFPKYYFKLNKILDSLSYPLDCFNKNTSKYKNKSFYKRLVRDFKRKITNWKRLKPIRGMIEDWNKLTKEAFSMKKIHRFTYRSVVKYVSLNALLAGIITLLGYNSKKAIQCLSEW